MYIRKFVQVVGSLALVVAMTAGLEPFKLGDIVAVRGLEYCVGGNARRALLQTADGALIAPKTEFFVVWVDVWNKSRESALIVTFALWDQNNGIHVPTGLPGVLIDPKKQINPSRLTSLYNEADRRATIAPGEHKKGFLVFDMPVVKDRYRLLLTDKNGLEPESVVIEIREAASTTDETHPN